MTGRLDWPALMRAGLHGLGLTPEQFWRLTPLELRMMLGAEQIAPPLTRARLAELAAAFPDMKRRDADGDDRDVSGSVGCAGGADVEHSRDHGGL